MQIETKFAIGDEVWHVWGRVRRETERCTLCQGAGQVRVVGTEDTVSCPKCWGKGENESGEQHVDYTVSRTPLTIGLVRVAVEGPTRGDQSHAHSPIDMSNMGPRSAKRTEEYMAVETGVASGSVYKLEDLFATKDEAVAEAKLRTSLSRAAITRYERVDDET